MHNPIELSKKIEKIVIKGNKKKYYRFRGTAFYGGISTADTVGCNLMCKFCWSHSSVWNPKNTGEFYLPEQVVDKIQKIALDKGYNKLRISGGEPTIGRKHLISVLKRLHPEFLFILETNGILLGMDRSYVEELSEFKNLHVRVCFKGITPEEFFLLTSAKLGVEYQFKALSYLRDNGMSFNIAVVSLNANYNDFLKKLKEMKLDQIMIEKEKIILYPQVKKRLEKEGLLHKF